MVVTAAEAEAGGGKQQQDELPVLDFVTVHSTFMNSVRSCFKNNDVKGLSKTSQELASRDKENKKIALDQCLREFQARELILAAEGNIEVDVIQRYVSFVVQVAQDDLCTVSTPSLILADVFDLLPLAKCETFFKILEKEVATWKSPAFYASSKNNLLRTCNDLLRRLSRTQNTVFCGRILLFLAKFFPFSERSGLNVISEFNLDNNTLFTTVREKPANKEKDISVVQDNAVNNVKEPESEEKKSKDVEESEKESKKEENKEKDAIAEAKKSDEPEAMEIELIVEEKEKMEVERKKEDEKETKADRDFKLYCNFWQLQDYFRDPTQCYDKKQWEQFCSITGDIVTTFTRKKLDTRASKKEPVMKATADEFVEEYFPKYLTNQNLLNLQLNDSNFRRYVLMQFLILFQYLQSSVKFKTESQVLSTDQGKWIDDQRKKTFKLLEETPPNGKSFCSSAKAILKREQIWIKWKNEGCRSLVIPTLPAEGNGEAAEGGAEAEGGDKKNLPSSTANTRKRKRPLGDMMKLEAKHGKINLGNKGLTRLWNINPDNLEACKDSERNFLPSLQQYFEEPIHELNPHNAVEEQYKKVNQGEWGWRALRLMSRRSQHFFLIGNCQISKLPEYLEHMMNKMAQDFGINIMEQTNGEATNGNADDKAAAMNLKLTDEQIASLAVKLADNWEALIPKFGLPSDKVDECKVADNNQEKCLKLISAWVQAEGEGASPEEITYIVGALKLSQLIEGVF